MPDENATEAEKKRFGELLKIEIEKIKKEKETEYENREQEVLSQYHHAVEVHAEALKVFTELTASPSFMARRTAELTEIENAEKEQTKARELVKITYDKVVTSMGLVDRKEVTRYGRKDVMLVPRAGPIKVIEDLIGLKDAETEPLCSGYRRGRKFSRPSEQEGYAVWQAVVGLAVVIAEKHPDYLTAKKNGQDAENNRYTVRNKYWNNKTAAMNIYERAESELRYAERELKRKEEAKDTIRQTIVLEGTALATTIVEGIMSKEKAVVDVKYKARLDKDKKLRAAKRYLMDLMGLRKTIDWSEVLTQSQYVDKGTKVAVPEIKPTEDKITDRTDVVVEQVEQIVDLRTNGVRCPWRNQNQNDDTP